MSQGMETKVPSALRRTSSKSYHQHKNDKRSEKETGTISPTTSPASQLRPANTRLYSYCHGREYLDTLTRPNTSTPVLDTELTTHLLKAVHFKTVVLHDGSHLRCQSPQQLPGVFFGERWGHLRHWQRRDEIYVFVRLGFGLIDAVVDHRWICVRGLLCAARRRRCRRWGCSLSWTKWTTLPRSPRVGSGRVVASKPASGFRQPRIRLQVL